MVTLQQQGGWQILRYLPPYADTDERAYLDALVEIGRYDGDFVLLTIFAGGGHLSQAGEREQALWFKATRARFAQHCKAIAIVRPGATEKMAETFRKLWPMPLTATADEAAARAFLAQHMAMT
ncbi:MULTISPECIES: hypothetical protein [unclassified Beijerinckia]|uniref:hypothetical protein n=1 Tax=unclassified Beijerinckia TaxID=2638183 RepID=UPI0008960CDA|nr:MULTISPECIES: hypothetical protein [unclassified Beijerinckia]MDH7798299.1 hypothetical protein [Beijerinckia sp. GAS462]SED16186.1 hypothetical protein SAMN05443249_4595 [Beijerinckia sp. 28-YEA-48]